MSRNSVLAATALCVCVSFAYAGPKGLTRNGGKPMAKIFSPYQDGHVANGYPAGVIALRRGAPPSHNVVPDIEHAIFSNYSKDANAQFVSWYGFTAANESASSGCSGSNLCLYHEVAENALAFTPAADVKTKKVTVPLFSFSASAQSQYEVDIYSSVGGLPGKVIATSRQFTASDTSPCCAASRTVAIKTNLKAGTQYFIGVAGVCCNAHGGWEMEDTDMSGAAVDYFHLKATFYNSSGVATRTFSSPWHASTYLPETGAVILK